MSNYRRLRISHNHPQRDFAPGVLNIVERSTLTNVNFYKIETFHSSPFYDQNIPLFINDIVNSQVLPDIYGIDSVRLEREGVILINNHPIRRVRILANIVDYQNKTIQGFDYYIFTLDDFTKNQLSAKIKTTETYFTEFTDQFVEIIGKVGRFKEINIESFRIIPSAEYHRKLFEFWGEAFKFKEILKTPWYQTPQINNSRAVVSNSNHLNNRRGRMNQISLNGGNEDEDEPDYEFFIVDSQIYTKSNNLKSFSQDEEDIDDSTMLDSGSDDEVIEMTPPHCHEDLLEYSDITLNLFQSSTIFQPLNASAIENFQQSNWRSITTTNISDFVPLTPQQDLILTIFKWVIRHFKLNFTIDDLLANIKISTKLNALINTGVIDLDDEIKPIVQLRYENLESLLGTLSTLFTDTYCSKNLINLFQDLETQLKSLRYKRVRFITKEYIKNHNAVNKTDLNCDLSVLNHLIYWYFVNENDKSYWMFNEDLHWGFINDEVREKRVLKVRR